MILIRIAVFAALLVASLPAWAGFGFGPIQMYANPDLWMPGAVLVEDVNNDGLDDVLMAYEATQAPYAAGLAVFMQDPVTHALMGPATYPIEPPGSDANAAYSIQAVDVDGDGERELVIGHVHGFSVLSPSDGFSIVATGRPDDPDPLGGPTIARVADFNGDGQPDIAFLSGLSAMRKVSMFFGDGAGHFSAGQAALAFPDTCCFVDMRPLDFNDDGRMDLVLLVAPLFGLGSPADFGFRGYDNGGNGSFSGTPALSLPYQAAFGMDLADVDGDGFQDLVGSLRNQPPYSFANGAIAFLHGRLGRKYLAKRQWVGTPGGATEAVKVGDLDGDGKHDPVFGEHVAGDGSSPCYLDFALAAKAVVQRFHAGQACANGLDAIDIGDINGDGLQDVVIASQGAGLGWTLGTNSPDIVNLVVGEGLSSNAAAFTLGNGSTSASIAAPSVDITYSVNRGKIELTDWPQQCTRPDPQALRITCMYPDLAVGQSATGIVHYAVLQSQPYMQLHANATATTTTEETVTNDNAATAAFWIRTL